MTSKSRSSELAATAVVSGLVLALCATVWSSPAAAVSEYDLEAQLETLLQWWPGEYDNHEQIVRQSGGGLSALTNAPFYRVHSRYARIQRPALGTHVVSAIDYRDDDPRRVLRERTYAITIDKAAGALRIAQHAPRPSGATSGGGELAPLGAGCDLLLRFVGGQFEGGLEGTSCRVGGRPVEYGLVVGPRSVWYREQTGHAWFQQTRARQFTCMVQENAEGDMRKTRHYRTIRLHDQGGRADIPWPDGRTLTFTIHTRAFASPTDREFPLFRIHEKGKDVPIAYAYAVDDATRFGLNLGWFYVRCYAEGQDLGADAIYATAQAPQPAAPAPVEPASAGTITWDAILAKYSDPDSKFVVLEGNDGIRVHYKDQGAGPAVLLVHSSMGDLKDWDAWVEVLQKNYRVVRLDLPAFGLTGPVPSGNYSIDRYLSMVDALMDTLGIERFAIVGTSYGGLVAFRYAATRIDRITALVLANSAGVEYGGRGGTTERARSPQKVFTPELKTNAAVEAGLKSVINDPSTVTAAMVQRKTDYGNVVGRDREAFVATQLYERGNPQRVLGRVRAPALVLWGGNSRGLSPETAQAFVDAMKNAKSTQKIIYDGGGHLLHIERPAQTVRDVKAFLDREVSRAAKDRND